MASSHWFRSIRHATVAFFRHDLALHRDEKGDLKVVLQERPDAGAPRNRRLGEPGAAVLREEGQALSLTRAQLADVLDESPELRPTMRHLVVVEHALARHGFAALSRLPLPLLVRARAQFEGLVVNWSPVGLALLRARLAGAVIDRERAEGSARGAPTQAPGDRTGTPAGGDPATSDDDDLGASTAHGLDVLERSDDEALAAAYAALGSAAPVPPPAVVAAQAIAAAAVAAAPAIGGLPALARDTAATAESGDGLRLLDTVD